MNQVHLLTQTQCVHSVHPQLPPAVLAHPSQNYIPADMQAKVQLVSSGSASSSPHHRSGLQSERKLESNSRPLSSGRSECALAHAETKETHSYMRKHEGMHVKAGRTQLTLTLHAR